MISFLQFLEHTLPILAASAPFITLFSVGVYRLGRLIAKMDSSIKNQDTIMKSQSTLEGLLANHGESISRGEENIGETNRVLTDMKDKFKDATQALRDLTTTIEMKFDVERTATTVKLEAMNAAVGGLSLTYEKRLSTLEERTRLYAVPSGALIPNGGGHE